MGSFIKNSTEVLIGGLLIFAVVFNALLAFANQNVMHISTAHVVACEVLIVFMVWGIALTRFSKYMYPWLYLALSFFVVAMLIGILNPEFNPKYFRDILLITTFGLLGICHKNYDVIPIFKWLTIIIIGVMLFEEFFTENYISLFNPSSYFFNTRGIGDYDGTGLFKNVMKYEGRFSLGLFGSHRLSSLFLEQTTLGNYSIILALFTSVFWRQLTMNNKLLFCASIFLIIAATDSRLSIGTIGLFIVLHILVKALPRYTNVLYMPLFLIITAIVFYDSNMQGLVDDLKGRLSWNIAMLSDMNLYQLIGMDTHAASTAADSGYAYLIFTQSIIGLIILWLFSSYILPQTTIEDKRMAHMASLFIVFNLAVGSTVLSIKTSAPLWFMVGYIYAQTKDINIKRKQITNEC